MLNLLEVTALPAALLDWSGRVIAMNAGAEALIGNGLLCPNGHLKAVDAASDSGLQRLLGAALAAATPADLHAEGPAASFGQDGCRCSWTQFRPLGS